MTISKVSLSYLHRREAILFESKRMQRWYDSINKQQKIFLFIACVPFIFIYGLGIIPLGLLIYLQLGSDQPLFSSSQGTPKAGDQNYLEWANREGEWADRTTDNRPND